MTRTESLYFDLVRVVAAMFVLVGHVVMLMPGVLPFENYGDNAVICFFVISGYVISFVSNTKELSGTDYFIARATRIYSVALPAIILTVICDFVGRNLIGASIYAHEPHDWPLVRIASALTFTNELWFGSVFIFSNGPYWSLCYEVWYYAIFGAAAYLKGRSRLVAVGTLMGLAGPKILLLFPIWLLGVALYHYKKTLGLAIGAATFVASAAGLVVMSITPFQGTIEHLMSGIIGHDAFKLLEFSGDFPFYYLFGCLVAINFLSVRSFEGVLRYSPWIANTIRWASASTFSLYLFHRPLLLIFKSAFAFPSTILSACGLIVMTVASAVLLSYATERRKQYWRKFFTFIVSTVRLPSILTPQKTARARSSS